MRKIKKSVLIILILFISIGFAVLTANINIGSVLSFKQNTFDIHLENPSIYETTTSLNSSTSLISSTSLSFSTVYTIPGEAVDVLFYIVNDGTIDASISSITTTLTNEQSEYIDYRFNYLTDNSLVKNNDVIYAGQARKVIGHFEYKYDIDDFIDLNDLSVVVTINFVQAPTSKNNVWNYEYVGDYQTFVAPKTGSYKIELWGASGGALRDADRGLGAYTSGKINLDKGDVIYLYVGSAGNSYKTTDSTVNEIYNNPFNGGGRSVTQTGNNHRYWGVGGSATDVRLVSGNWDNFNSLKSRIMVAGGGGGAYCSPSENIYRYGGSGGGLSGYKGFESNFNYGAGATGGTQTTGGYSECIHANGCMLLGEGNYGLGTFGVGGSYNFGSNGGGSGYFGGGASAHVQGGGGGSSYISGHNGCVAIEESSTSNNITFPTKNGVACTDGTTDQDCSVHYSGKEFIDTVMIDGKGYNWTTEVGDTVVGMPNYTGTGTMVGNSGDGYAKITLEDSILCKKAKILHTKNCDSGDANKMCLASGYSSDEIITYGNIPTGNNYKVGDAFDCDVNGDGAFNSTDERFYYVTDLADNNKYAVLIYSNFTVDGLKVTGGNPINNFYNVQNHNYNGPVTIIEELPTVAQWPNIRLYNYRRQIISSDGSIYTDNGSKILPVFKYTNMTSRLITRDEVINGCTTNIGKKCEFLLEATSFDSYSLYSDNWGVWTETPSYSSDTIVCHIDSHLRGIKLWYGSKQGNLNVKPVIEVPKNRME